MEYFAKFESELLKSPKVTIHGIVDPESLDTSDWRTPITLVAWRIETQPVKRTRLYVHLYLFKSDCTQIGKTLSTNAVVTLAVHLAETNPWGPEPRALLTEILDTGLQDAELLAIRAELQKPYRISDSLFGMFTLNRRLNLFETKTLWDKKPVRLLLNGESDTDAPPEKSLACSRALWSDLAHWNKQSQALILQEYLKLKNEQWLEDDEEPMSPENFLAKITLQTIAIKTDGSFEFWYDDGDMFGGHALVAIGNLARGFHRTSFSG